MAQIYITKMVAALSHFPGDDESPIPAKTADLGDSSETIPQEKSSSGDGDMSEKDLFFYPEVLGASSKRPELIEYGYSLESRVCCDVSCRGIKVIYNWVSLVTHHVVKSRRMITSVWLFAVALPAPGHA